MGKKSYWILVPAILGLIFGMLLMSGFDSGKALEKSREAEIAEYQKKGFRIVQEDADLTIISIAWRDPKGFVEAIGKAVEEVEVKSGRKVARIGPATAGGTLIFYFEDE